MSGNCLDPIGVFLAICGTKGERLLFRYPFEITEKQKTRGPNPYSLVIAEDIQNRATRSESTDSLKKAQRSSSLIDDGAAGTGVQWLRTFTDTKLTNIFAFNIKSSLYNQKFEIKIDDVTFVGHPHHVQAASNKHLGAERVLHDTPQRSVHSYGSSIQMFHVIFALQGDKVSQFVVDSYHRLSHKLATAINHEERRQSYLNQNVKQITSLLDMHQGIDSPTMSPYETVLEKNALATLLKKVFDDIVRDGSTSIRVNDWVHVSFCLLPKIHRNPVMNDARLVEQIAKMRPYHGLLLLASEQEIFSELPIDASSALVRFVRIISPLSNFQLLAMEAGVTLKQVYAMAGHLIYWAKARLIFPVCETNVYALAPEASTKVMSEMCDEFSQRFNDLNLLELLADMSMPVPLRDLVNPFSENMDSGRITQIVIWCLRKNLLVQLHTYVYLIPGEVMDLNYLQNEGLNWVTLPHEVRLKVNLVPAAVNDYQTQDIQTLMKLVPYFRGNVHLEEMMFNVNIKRSHLMIVLDKFRDVLVIVVHEDPNLPAFL